MKYFTFECIKHWYPMVPWYSHQNSFEFWISIHLVKIWYHRIHWLLTPLFLGSPLLLLFCVAKNGMGAVLRMTGCLPNMPSPAPYYLHLWLCCEGKLGFKPLSVLPRNFGCSHDFQTKKLMIIDVSTIFRQEWWSTNALHVLSHTFKRPRTFILHPRIPSPGRRLFSTCSAKKAREKWPYWRV